MKAATRSERSSIAVGFDAGSAVPTGANAAQPQACDSQRSEDQFARLISKRNYMAQEEKTDQRTLEETAAHLRLVINRASRRMRQEAGTELRPSRASALVSVELHGPLTPSELAEIEAVKRPTATRVLRGLEEEGLIERTPDPRDGRSALISITEQGRERLRRLRRRKNAYLARRMRGLDGEDVEALERAAAILAGLLEVDRPAGRGEGSA